MHNEAYEIRAKERFLQSFTKTESCWLWTKVIEIYGYGIFWYHNQNQKAHRMSWIYFKGEIPDDLCVLHKCDIRNCINPDHLWLGTKTDNNWDKIKKERHQFGENHYFSRFTNKERDDIAIRYRNGESQKSLAKIYNTNQSTIGHIVHSNYAGKRFGIIEKKIIRKLSPEQKDEIAVKYRQGYTRFQLMEIYKVGHDAIWKSVYNKKAIEKYGPILKKNVKLYKKENHAI